jgi:hypothetical protein
MFTDGINLVAQFRMCLPDGWGLERLRALDPAIQVNAALDAHPAPPDCADWNEWVAQVAVDLFPDLHGVAVAEEE